eukprot:CAMPEP_0172318906 /NCGR_PEP_ID=MMETSP1058-20130122/36174_1 /TAXON_ID=83371 /ORGANISM="Detonula confervacea, Strain CCMP 353" /LENGTH=882 /DNA_ID=CAMNT_0013033829 /DNA_START=122 /DNA_END=2771 /DNA_ORIENTATION=+
MSQFHNNSVVHLSIVKAKPSFTEPWKKMSPISLVGNGVVIPWNTAEAGINSMEKEGMASGPTEETKENDDCRSNNTIRILTNAHAVQYATSIRARTQNSPTSVGCTVEWISLAMDLALLKVEGVHEMEGNENIPSGWKAIASPFTTNLPHLGEDIACISFPKTTVSNMSAPSSIRHFGRYSSNASQSSWHVDLNLHRGTVAGLNADEDEHFMLRMNMNLSMPVTFGESCASGSSDRGGGLIVDGNGNIMGMVAASLPQLESTGIHSVIPGLVIDNFLSFCNQMHGASSQPSATICNTDGDCSASALCDTGDETSQSEKGNHSPPKGTVPNKMNPTLNGINRLPGIPTLGITGFQTLENKTLRRSLGLEECDGFADGGVRILGINHTVHPANDNEYQSQCKEDRKCHTSMLRTDDVLLAVDDEPIRLDGTVRLTPGRDNERVDFRWLISQRPVGATVKLDVARQRKRMELHATLSAPRHLVPKCDEGEDAPSYVICGGCVFVPLTQAWLLETLEKRQGNSSSELHGFQRYLQEQRKGDQQIIILSHVLADDVNVGYHGYENMVVTSFNGQRPNNMQHLMDLLVKRDNGQSLEFRCSYVQLDRAKVVICMDAKEVMDSEPRIMRNYMIDSWCANVLSPALKKEAEGKAHRHGSICCLKTMRALRTTVRETTLEVRWPTTDDSNSAVAATRRIMDFTEAHKMQSAPLFAGKYTEEGGWTNVKTKHLSQLCVCGKSTRFYCICSVGQMRCKDCFIKHCRDNTNHHACSKTCAPDCEAGAEVLAEGVGLVTTKKRKRNNPTQAIQSRCVVCKAKNVIVVQHVDMTKRRHCAMCLRVEIVFTSTRQSITTQNAVTVIDLIVLEWYERLKTNIVPNYDSKFEYESCMSD